MAAHPEKCATLPLAFHDAPFHPASHTSKLHGGFARASARMEERQLLLSIRCSCKTMLGI